MSLRIADKSTCSADGFGWLEAWTNLLMMMIYMMTIDHVDNYDGHADDG